MGTCAYENEQALLEACPTLQEKVQRIDQIITSLEDVLIDNTVNMETGSYMLDDGQTKINRTFRGPNEIAKAIEAFLRLRNLYLRRLTGGRRVLTPLDNLNTRKNGFY